LTLTGSIQKGAAGAIGQGLAESFAVAGAKLVLTYNKTPPPPELRERCVEFGAGGVTFVKCNVAELGGCEELVKEVSFLWFTSALLGLAWLGWVVWVRYRLEMGRKGMGN
jgi:NAD(P)-dependent dehydrogenase (short-subunit alcohol dehydrogenase family)